MLQQVQSGLQNMLKMSSEIEWCDGESRWRWSALGIHDISFANASCRILCLFALVFGHCNKTAYGLLKLENT
ncbi:unnamed protein product, partial [Urochloa humidicola]